MEVESNIRNNREQFATKKINAINLLGNEKVSEMHADAFFFLLQIFFVVVHYTSTNRQKKIGEK